MLMLKQLPSNYDHQPKPLKELKQFALVTRRPYCPGGPKKLCFTTLSLIPVVSIAKLSVAKQSSFGLPGQYGRRVTRVNSISENFEKGSSLYLPVFLWL